MRRSQLEHILRAAAAITDESKFIVVGSQAILVQFANPPADLLVSNEIDIYPENRPDLSNLIDGSLGHDSLFHHTFGVYADGIGPETANLPKDWRTRAKVLKTPQTGGATGVAPEIHDLLTSKLIAGREKDLAWARAAFAHGLADPMKIVPLLDQISADKVQIERAKERLMSLAKGSTTD